MRRYVRGLVDAGSFFEIHPLWAKEVTVGLARMDGQVVGIVGNNSMFKGGVLFVDSADKATRFITLCDAFNIPLIFIADVPGFMVGTAVERAGIIRHGAKPHHRRLGSHRAEVLSGRAQSIRCGPLCDGRSRFRSRRHHRAAHREDRRHGAEAAVNAVYANKIAAIADEAERRLRAGEAR